MSRMTAREADRTCGAAKAYLTVVCRAVVFLSALLLGGCVTDAPLPTPTQQSSVIDYTRSLEQVSSTLLDKVVVAIPNPGTHYSDYTDWSANWCPRHQRVHSTNDVAREIGNFCKQAGGTYTQSFCRNPTNPDQVLFYASVFVQGDCQNVANPVGVHIIEPKVGHASSQGYLAALETVGYRTQAQIVAEAAQRKREAVERERMAQERIERERERVAKEMPLLTSRGTKICRTDNGWIYIGFVEDVAGQKIQIRVADMRLAMDPSSGVRPGGFAPGQLIWDFPANWRVCE